MGNKVEMTEVVSFSDELKSAASSLKSQLDAIKKSANQIAEIDSFTGLTADSAKDYLKDFHMKVVDSFTTLFESLSTQLSSHIVTFQSEVDSSNAAHLDSNYLKDEQTKLNDQYSKVSESHSNIKAIIQKISDISSLTRQAYRMLPTIRKQLFSSFKKRKTNCINLLQKEKMTQPKWMTY